MPSSLRYAVLPALLNGVPMRSPLLSGRPFAALIHSHYATDAVEQISVAYSTRLCVT